MRKGLLQVSWRLTLELRHRYCHYSGRKMMPLTNTPHAPNAPFFVDREVIVLTRNGVWLADGTEITHEPTAKLFARSLKKDERGYYLHIGRETKTIEVEDTAYFVTRIDGSPFEGFQLSINDE